MDQPGVYKAIEWITQKDITLQQVERDALIISILIFGMSEILSKMQRLPALLHQPGVYKLDT